METQTQGNLGFGCHLQGSDSVAVNGLNYGNSSLPHWLVSQFEKQKREIDCFLSLQNQRLHSTLQQQREQHLLLLVEKASALLEQKEEELLKAYRRTLELEQRLSSAQRERETWQRISGEKEAMVRSLNNKLEQIRDGICSSSSAEDAASSCNSSPRNSLEERKWGCRVCKCRNSCMLLLPCRHLCSCIHCEGFLHLCPVCSSVKRASMQVLMD